MSDVFISYSRKDIAFARLIRESLIKSQIEIWIDWERIPVGERWWDEICEAIENANVFMFIISKNSIGSHVCKDEIDHALKNHKRIIPILVDNLEIDAIKQFAPELPELNWIIFERDQIFRIEKNPEIETDKPEDSQVAFPKLPQYEKALGLLSKAIHTDWEWVKYHTRLQVDALRWESNQYNPAYLMRGAALEESEQSLLRAIAKDPQPTDLQVEFVTASRKEETSRQQEQLKLEQKARRRQKLVIWAVCIGLVVATVLGVFALNQRNQAVENLLRSEKLRLSAEAENLILQPYGNIETTALLSLRALQGGYLTQADSPLQKSLPYLYATRNFVGHTDAVISVAFSPDRKQVLTGSLDKTAMLWDVETNTVLRTFIGHTGSVEGVAFSPDGKYVLTGSSDKTAKLWDIFTGTELHTFSDTSSVTRTSVEMKRSCHSVAFSPDGKYVLTASDDGDAKLWDAASGVLVRRFQGHTNIVRSVAFSPDGKSILTGGLDNTARLWDTETGDELRTFGHSTWVYSVAFFPTGNKILTWTNNATVWDIDTGEMERTFGNEAIAVISVAFSPDGKYLFTASASQVTPRLWDVASGEIIRSFSGHTDFVEAVAFSTDGNYVLTGSHDGTARLWVATSSDQGRTFRGHSDIVDSLAFSPDGKFVLTGGDDSTARLWDAITYSEVRIFDGHSEDIWSVAFSPDGKYVLTGSLDETARLWDTTSGALVQTFKGHMDAVWGVAFSPDGKQVVTGSYDHTARLWDVASGALVHTFSGHTEGVRSVAFSPDGKYVLTGSIDWDAKLWDAFTGAEVRTLNEQSSIQDLTFSPDGRYVLTGNFDHSANLWDTSNGTVVQTFYGHTDAVSSVAFSPDGNYALTGSYDKTAKLWDIATGVEIRTFVGHKDAVTDVDFSPDGKYVITSSLDIAQVWDIDPNQTIQWACTHLTRDLTPEERTRYLISDDNPTCPGISQDVANALPTTVPFTTPLPSPTSSLVMPATSTDVYIFDAFTDNSMGWPIGAVDGDLWVGARLIENGILDLSGVSRDSMLDIFFPNQEGDLSDQQISTSIYLKNPSPGGMYGLILREKNRTSFYTYLIDVNGFYSFYLLTNGNWKPLIDWEINPYIKNDEWNRMAVQATGDHFRLFFNNKLLAEVDDDTLSSGRSGLIIQAYEAGEEFNIQFDDFEISLQYE